MNLPVIGFLAGCVALVLLLGQWWLQSRRAAVAAAGALVAPPIIPVSYVPPVPYVPPGLACPYCRSQWIGQSFWKMTTGGVVMLIAGLCLIPVLIGIVFIIASFQMRERAYHCQNCGKTF